MGCGRPAASRGADVGLGGRARRRGRRTHLRGEPSDRRARERLGGSLLQVRPHPRHRAKEPARPRALRLRALRGPAVRAPRRPPARRPARRPGPPPSLLSPLLSRASPPPSPQTPHGAPGWRLRPPLAAGLRAVLCSLLRHFLYNFFFYLETQKPGLGRAQAHPDRPQGWYRCPFSPSRQDRHPSEKAAQGLGSLAPEPARRGLGEEGRVALPAHSSPQLGLAIVGRTVPGCGCLWRAYRGAP